MKKAIILLFAVAALFQSNIFAQDNSQAWKHKIAYFKDVEAFVKGKIAMFIIPLNYNTSGNFTDFELKASTNNFTRTLSEHADDEWVKLQFYSQSELADMGRTRQETAQLSGGNDVATLDRMWLFTCTSHLTAPYDSRSFKYIRNTSSEWQHPMQYVVALVDTSCLVRYPDESNEWLSSLNENLMWCFHRYIQTGSEIQHEKDDGDAALWYPIMPITWFKTMPRWAAEQIGQ